MDLKKHLNRIAFCVLGLAAMVLCAAAVMKALDLVFSLGYMNIWAVGCKMGLAAWLFLVAVRIYRGKRQENP